MNINDDLAKASEELGGGAKFSLLKQTGRLKSSPAESAEDVTGFDYVASDNGKCYGYYAANPPLVGLTKPEPVPCPLGLAVVNDYKISYQEVIDIFHKGNWGSKFTDISLSKPLTPAVKDPMWYLVSDTGVHVVINANTGEPNVQQ
ncbi:MAG TPA: hypothetical protein VMR45_01765 [Patescibacteria group bacterium]|nr:hypothetical protein [Patescibacteria group bacterium]